MISIAGAALIYRAFCRTHAAAGNYRASIVITLHRKAVTSARFAAASAQKVPIGNFSGQ
jgi:hypothetical protein